MREHNRVTESLLLREQHYPYPRYALTMANTKYASYYSRWIDMYLNKDMRPAEIAAACPSGAHRNTIRKYLKNVGVYKDEHRVAQPSRPLGDRLGEGLRPAHLPDGVQPKLSDYRKDVCWEWQGQLCDGYGYMSRPGWTRPYLTHRIAYELYHKTSLPEGSVILHLCDNPRCNNPYHLAEGTQLDNMRDAARKGRSIAKLSPQIVWEIRVLKHCSELSNKELAKMYGVTEEPIRRAVNPDAQIPTYTDVPYPDALPEGLYPRFSDDYTWELVSAQEELIRRAQIVRADRPAAARVTAVTAVLDLSEAF